MQSSVSVASYLDTPRIHFIGNFRADVDTRNNDRCNYIPDYVTPDLNRDWNSNGTNEFEFINTKVSEVNYDSPVTTITEENDPILSAFIVTNLERPFAKITDLDTDAQVKSTIYGMNFGISFGYNDQGKRQVAFMGKWTPSVIAQDVWKRMKCYKGDQDSFPFGSQGTTILTDIEWGDLHNSPSLQQLKDKCESGSNKLSIRVSYYYYTRNYEPLVPYRFTLGNIVGTIGVYNDGETLNFGGDRLMISEGLDHDPPQLTFNQSDSCYGLNISEQAPWTSNAPFKIRDTGNKEVVVDLSNALPIMTDGTQRDIGELYLGYNDTSGSCLQLIEPNTPIPYMANNWLESGALAVYSLTNNQYQYLLSNSLMVIQKVQGNQNRPLCGNLPSIKTESGIVVLKEREYFIRPLNYYVDRLEYKGNTSSQTLYVTHYGAPAQNVKIKIKQAKHKTTHPIGGVAPYQNTKTTDAKGQVTFLFSVTQAIPYPRKYTKAPCPPFPSKYTLPIDGQVYKFNYCILNESESDCNPLMKVSQITIKAYSTVNYTSPYTWVDHVGVIFTHYNHIAPVMKSIVNLSNYTDVTQPWNIKLINHSMQLDFEHPNYMPATRDLSPSKQKMILEWLEDPKYSHKSDTQPGKPKDQVCQHPSITKGMSKSSKFFVPPRCELEVLNLYDELKNTDSYFSDILNDSIADIDKGHSRPLHSFLTMKSEEFCSVDKLKKQLQQAVQLEFYTIPLYLTAMYSIVDGCNVEIYHIIRHVVMQEMMHMAQAANLLISMGETPVIDSPDFVPRYPAHGLPGGVLPNLQIDLKKLSLEHVYNVFMGIEVPTWEREGDKKYFHNNTIGEFYEEIIQCLDLLYRTHHDIINSSTMFKQVTWPWKEKDMELIKVDSVQKANESISQIIIQGEGFKLLPTSSLDGDYAHFFRFEEIVCQHKLVKINDSQYKYVGDPILFDPRGVWPMRENPDPLIYPNSNCLHAAKAFHHQYRGFLRKLQETFSCETLDCNPQKLLMEAIEMMEALQVHAKKLMWIKFNPNNPNDIRTCGPVWTYHWDINCTNNY